MEFLNLIMNGFAYIFNTIKKEVEIYLLMESSAAVSLGHDDCRRVREGRDKTPSTFEIYPFPPQINSRGGLTLPHFYSSLPHSPI